MVLLKDTIRRTCGGCPTVFEGKTTEGYDWYFRLRGGGYRVVVTLPSGYEKTLVSDSAPHPYDGVIGCDEMIDMLEDKTPIRFI